jgi:hypothetical protein
VQFPHPSGNFKPRKRENSLFFRILGLLKGRDRLARDCLHRQIDVSFCIFNESSNLMIFSALRAFFASL